MFGECHAHVIMDGVNYRKAVELHQNGVQDKVIHQCFEKYQEGSVRFVRDGGDNLGVSKRAKQIAGQYQIDYRTPVFAIHKKGHYGGIVGHGFSTMEEYHSLVRQAKCEGADFIKIMTTGIMDFKKEGALTGESLSLSEVKEMVDIAHDEKMSVMSHTNGVLGVQTAVLAGVDSIEHGNFMNESTLELLAKTNCVWVPTLVTVRNLLGCGRFSDQSLEKIISSAEKNLRYAYSIGVKVALGSDAGAYMVPHGSGIYDEYRAFCKIIGNQSEVDRWIGEGETIIKNRFSRKN
ncbi:MAG: amidohydrolase family protein [Eubacteriales bacterium]|nr:amidohydrolase family protein [Eubacteriales bacterium]